MDDPSVRRAVATDVPALQRLWAELIDHHAEGDSYFNRSPEAVDLHGARLHEELDQEDRLILIAEHDSEPVGFVIAEIRAGPDLFVIGPYGFVRDLGVTRSARRLGVGQRLYEAVLEWFAEHGVERAELDVTEANEVARRFWSRQGYRRLYTRMIVDLTEVTP
jgi:ribosomal protein S18 acetylase RimI-like enzyme